MPKDKKDTVIPPGVTNQEKYERLAMEADKAMTDEERKAVKVLADAGWLVLMWPRVENSTTARGMRNFQAKGRYTIGLVKNRIMR